VSRGLGAGTPAQQREPLIAHVILNEVKDPRGQYAIGRAWCTPTSERS
jgi:hypothetical protein